MVTKEEIEVVRLIEANGCNHKCDGCPLAVEICGRKFWSSEEMKSTTMNHASYWLDLHGLSGERSKYLRKLASEQGLVSVRKVDGMENTEDIARMTIREYKKAIDDANRYLVDNGFDVEDQKSKKEYRLEVGYPCLVRVVPDDTSGVSAGAGIYFPKCYGDHELLPYRRKLVGKPWAEALRWFNEHGYNA